MKYTGAHEYDGAGRGQVRLNALRELRYTLARVPVPVARGGGENINVMSPPLAILTPPGTVLGAQRSIQY